MPPFSAHTYWVSAPESSAHHLPNDRGAGGFAIVSLAGLPTIVPGLMSYGSSRSSPVREVIWRTGSAVNRGGVPWGTGEAR